MGGTFAKPVLALLLAALLAGGLAACGGSGGSASSTASGSGSTAAPGPASTPQSTTSPPAAKPPAPKVSGPARAFLTPGGDNSIQTYGAEASASQREQAAATLEAYLAARQQGDWAGACSYLAAATRASLEKLASASKKFKRSGCAAILAALSAGVPAAARAAAAATAGVASLRVRGDRAFALYHGAHRTDYFMPMASEGGRWKVASLAPSAFP